MYGSPLRKNAEVPEEIRTRIRILSAVAALILLGLFFRIWHLQIINGDKFRSLSESNRIASRVVRSPRGVIFDANGQVLADNRPSFNVYLIQKDATNLKEEIRLLAVATDQPYEKLRQKIRKSSPFRPLLIKADADRRSVAFIEEHRPELPGVFIQVAPLRHYPQGNHAGHLLGYLGEVDSRQLKKLKKLSYRQGDLLGKYGVEFSHEKYLRGETGFKQVEVDAYGREFKVVRPFVDKPGKNIQLTLNYGLQKKAEELFKDYQGSIIAIDPADGAILAMVSNPSFDPNKFASGILKEDWRALTTDPLKPLQNRATRGQYPPGSIFKIVMAFATLEEKILSATEAIQCNGGFFFGGRVFQDWKKGGHGPIDLTQSLAQSCDVYYYQAGNKLGIERIAKYSRMFGLGSPTGFAPREKGGLVPSDEWKKRRFKEKWYSGETISVSIGQGFNLVTPMQMANLIATTANGGTLWKPYIVKRIFGKNGSIIFEHKPTYIRKIPLDKKIFEAVQNGLREVVNGERGTAKKAQIPGVIVAGKTGTAQTVRLAITGRKRKPESLPRKFRDHGWFVAYAPFEAPKIAVAILGEHAGRPGSFFAPTARELISYYLQIKKSQKVLAFNKKSPSRPVVEPDRTAGAAR